MRGINRLTAVTVNRKQKPGRYADGGGLWLQVKEGGTKSWLFRYTRLGVHRHMGLGPLISVSLLEARERAKEARQVLLDGRDPVTAKRDAESSLRLTEARAMTFAQCADAYLTEHLPGFKNPKHQVQWQSSLRTAQASFGQVSVAEIDTAMVVKLLTPIWSATPESASRLRGRIEKVLDWAKVRELRSGENPARWTGHLQHLLKAPAKGSHHSAMPWAQLPEFMAKLRTRDSISARALEFTILTAARTSEVLGARWDEIDFATGNSAAPSWTIPASRMKSGREHRVPLSDRAVEILKDLSRSSQKEPRGSAFIFPGAKAGAPLSNMAMLEMTRGVAGNGYTTHGFRSAFRDWCAERTNYANHVAEMALAHVIGDKVEAAYRRGDLFAKRQRLMQEWSRFCLAPATSADVVPLNRAG